MDNTNTKIKIKSKQIKVIKKNFNSFNLNKINVDIIIHAATIASPIIYRKYPLETSDANVLGIRKILDYGKKNKRVSILFFSSSEIYGNPDNKNIPTKENYNGDVSCVGPRSCYDESQEVCRNFVLYICKIF